MVTLRGGTLATLCPMHFQQSSAGRRLISRRSRMPCARCNLRPRKELAPPLLAPNDCNPASPRLYSTVTPPLVFIPPVTTRVISLSEMPFHYAKECDMPLRCFALVALLVLAGPSGASAEEPATSSDQVSYFKQVLPIFRTKNCTGCHQPAKQGGEYVMTEFADAAQGRRKRRGGGRAGPPDEELPDRADHARGRQGGDAQGRAAADGRRDRHDHEVDRARGQGRHARLATARSTTPSIRRSTWPRRCSSRSSTRPRATCSPSAAITKCCCTRPTARGLVARLVGQSERIESARFSPDGKMLAVTGGSPGRFGELQIWDVEKREMKLSLMIGYDTLLRRELVAQRQDGRLRLPGQHDARHSIAETGKQVLFSGAHSDWVLDTTFSRQQRPPDQRQPRHVDEADRSRRRSGSSTTSPASRPALSRAA